MPWIMLSLAIAAEVVGTLALRASAGFTRLLPSIIVVVGYALAFLLMAQALKSIGVGTVYATWSGVGTVGVAIGGWLLFSETLNAMAVAGIALIVAGVVVLNLSGAGAHG